MLGLLEIIIFLLLIWSFAFYRVSPKIWTPIILIYLLILTIFAHISWWLLAPLWVVFAAIALVINLPLLRKAIISQVVMAKVQKKLPQMSETERIALEAGDTWWESELFRGNPQWKNLLAQPPAKLTAAEQSFLDNQVETLCTMINDWEIVHELCDLPKSVWDYLKNQGFFGLVISKEYGGHGFSAYAHSCVVTKIASRSFSAAVNTMVPNSLGPAELLTMYGTEEQKKYYLPRLAKGIDIPCFGLTSPYAGSDAGNIPDTGIICEGDYSGKKIIGIKLNFHKHYITLAPIATLLGIAFKLYDPQHLLGEQGYVGITLCLIPHTHPGVEVGSRHLPINLAFMNGPIRGKDVFIPLDWVIGGKAMLGQGWKMLMECLSVGRGISLPSLATATGKLCYRTTGAYGKIREQFKTPIGLFQGVGAAMARIGGFTYICEAARMLTTVALDNGVKPSLISAITKYHLTEFARQIANDAMDIHAGRGIQLGPRNYIGNVYMGMPVSITVEGANLLTRNLIIFGQGATRCHPYILQEMAALAERDLPAFDELLRQHVGFFIRNIARSLLYGLTGGRFISTPKQDWTKNYYRQLTRMSCGLALTADLAMMLMGGQLKREESLSARLGDVLSHLYLASSVLKYYQESPEPITDGLPARWALEYSLYSIQQAFNEFFINFPYRLLAKLLQKIIFPYGRQYHYPKDKLSQEIAQQMMQPTTLRERLTNFCYISQNENDTTGRIEAAFKALIAAEKAKIKLRQALRTKAIPKHDKLTEQLAAAKQAGIIDEHEAEVISVSHFLAADAVQVDEFPQNSLARKSTDGRQSTTK